ncbi:MAG: phosphodiester glycosidase family protein [Ignavibacteria bacterium]|nr:phosphodiester glycosidase family protein [Ignavibacteria bacterium]
MASLVPKNSDTLQTINEDTYTVYWDHHADLIIVKIHEISEYVFIPNPTLSLKEYAEKEKLQIVVNASYFDGYGPYTPAGYLKIKDSLYSQVKIDRQLQYCFDYNIQTRLLKIFPITHLESPTNSIIVQTGPLLMQHDTVCYKSIEDCINGTRITARTAIASDLAGLYIVISRRGYKLTEFAEKCKNSGIFSHDLQLINLDGGSSTALFIKEHPELSFHSEKILPILIGVK